MNEFVAEHSNEQTVDSDLVKHLKSIIKVLILLFLLNLFSYFENKSQKVSL